MDNELQNFCEEIIACLVKYGKVEKEAARRLVITSKICECKTELSKDLLFHEYPYYWAMHLLHSPSNPEWYQDRNLWPPSQDYVDEFYRGTR